MAGATAGHHGLLSRPWAALPTREDETSVFDHSVFDLGKDVYLLPSGKDGTMRLWTTHSLQVVHPLPS